MADEQKTETPENVVVLEDIKVVPVPPVVTTVTPDQVAEGIKIILEVLDGIAMFSSNPAVAKIDAGLKLVVGAPWFTGLITDALTLLEGKTAPPSQVEVKAMLAKRLK